MTLQSGIPVINPTQFVELWPWLMVSASHANTAKYTRTAEQGEAAECSLAL